MQFAGRRGATAVWAAIAVLVTGGVLLTVHLSAGLSAGVPGGRAGATVLLGGAAVITGLAATAIFTAPRLPRSVLVTAAVLEAVAAGVTAVAGIAWLSDALVPLLLAAFAMVNVAVGMPGMRRGEP